MWHPVTCRVARSVGTVPLAALLAAGLVFGQSSVYQHSQEATGAAAPRFAVVSVTPVAPGARPAPSTVGPVLPGGKYVDHRAVLAGLIIFAYPQFASPGKTLVGLPDWAYGTLFDFEAEPARGVTPSLAEMRQMMASALADRFQLKYHVRNERMPVLFLAVGPNGVQHITRAASGPPSTFIRFRQNRIVGWGFTMDDLAGVVGMPFMEKGTPVINRTGMTGIYDFDVPAATGTYRGPGGGESRYIADLKILGLALRSGEATVPVMVVDHVAKPRPN